MAENKKIWNGGWIGKIDERKGMGCLELLVSGNNPELKVIDKADGSRFGTLSMFGTFAGPSGVKYALGEEILNENGTMSVEVLFNEQNYQLQAIEKVKIEGFMKFRIYGIFYVHEYTKKDGSLGKQVRCNCNKFDRVWNNNNRGSAPVENTGDSTPAPAPAPTASEAEAAIEVPF